MAVTWLIEPEVFQVFDTTQPELGLTDLNDVAELVQEGFYISEALQISDKGEFILTYTAVPPENLLVGLGLSTMLQPAPFLAFVSVIPEPNTLALAIFAFIGFCLLKRKKKTCVQ